jgi:hypothetical protein
MFYLEYTKNVEINLVMNKNFRSLLLMMVLISFSACNSIKVKRVDRSERISRRITGALIDHDILSADTKNYLAQEGFLEAYEENRLNVLNTLVRRYKRTRNRDLLKALIELSYAYGKSLDNEESSKYYLSSCYLAYEYMFGKNINPPVGCFSYDLTMARLYYNYSMSDLFNYLKTHKLIRSDSFAMKTLLGNIKFRKPEIPQELLNLHPTDVLSCYDYIPENLESISSDYVYDTK